MIKEIIELLSDGNQSLVTPLLKTKVFASRLKNDELLDWVNREINGYNGLNEADIPNYRIAKALSSCTLQRGYQIENNTPVPISLIENTEAKKLFTEIILLDGVESLETLAKDKKKMLYRKLPVDFANFLTLQIRKKDPNLLIGNISVFTDISAVIQALTEIRSKFLDLLLSIEAAFPKIADIGSESPETLTNVNKQVTLIMKQININHTSEGSTVNIGDGNQINSASGEDIKQELYLESKDRETLNHLIDLITNAIRTNEFDSKDEIELEIQRLETQIRKQSPKKTIIKQSLETIHNLLTNIAANAWTNPVLTAIHSFLTSIG
ncbi:MAG: hypothetical protein IPO16_02640 [Saprospiraceae bacterium]|nr:hypothetical protein [Saprospiraceae bacterium]